MFNLNDERFDAKEGTGAIIFNEGKAGIAENVTLSIKRKTPEDKPNSPNYKLTFTDEAGGTVEMPFWYAENATEYQTVEQQVEKQGKTLKHVIRAIYGDGNLPAVSGTTAKEFLDSAMKAIHEGLKVAGKFRVFANYGVAPDAASGRTGKVSKYIGIRSWVPFMEPMSVPVAETRLKAGSFDAMSRVEESTVAAPAASSTLDDGEDW